MEKWNDRLKLAMDKRGVIAIDLARITQNSSASVSDWLSGKTKMMSADNVLKVCDYLKVNEKWLIFGKGESGLEDGEGITRTHKFHVHSGLGHPDTKSVLVHMFNAVGSMGPGTHQPEDDTITASLWLAEQWIRSNLERSITSTKNLAIITGHGDSMSPTFNDGDILLIDTGVKHANIDGVYVLSANNRLYIKRVRQRLDGQFEISSDNQTVKTVDILNGDHEITIHGRVVWAWNGKKL